MGNVGCSVFLRFLTIASFFLHFKFFFFLSLLCSGEINLQRASLRVTMINIMN